MKVYGIHMGSVHEGGATVSPLYIDIEAARSKAKLEADHRQTQVNELYSDDPEGLKQMAWSQIDENTWKNCIYEIVVYEYEVI